MEADFEIWPACGRCIFCFAAGLDFSDNNDRQLRPEDVGTTDAEPQTELMDKLEAGPQMRATDTVSGAEAFEIHTVRRNSKDIVMSGGELSR